MIEDIGFKEHEEIREQQNQKLVALIQYVANHSLFYQRHFANHKIDFHSIKSVEDLVKIPPADKDDLQKHNWDFLCVDRTSIAEYMSTSGTLGKPVTIALTQSDLERLAVNEATSFAIAGCSEDDIFQLMLTLDRQFMAGIAYYQGIQKLGASVIRVGPGLPTMQLDIINRLKPTVIVAVPSFLIRLIDVAKTEGIDLNASSVKRIICIGESIRNADGAPNKLAQLILSQWNVSLHSTYASTEMQTAFTECDAGLGGHLNPALLIVELLNEDNNLVEQGGYGEVTITTLGVEGMPLIRYKTGDIAKQVNTPCSCGRNSLKLGSIVGRKKQMLKWKGTTIFPPALVEIMHHVPEVNDFIIEATTDTLGMDEITVYLHVQGNEDQIRNRLELTFQSNLRVKPNIVFMNFEHLQNKISANSGRKVQRFVDKRQNL